MLQRIFPVNIWDSHYIWDEITWTNQQVKINSFDFFICLWKKHTFA